MKEIIYPKAVYYLSDRQYHFSDLFRRVHKSRMLPQAIKGKLGENVAARYRNYEEKQVIIYSKTVGCLSALQIFSYCFPLISQIVSRDPRIGNTTLSIRKLSNQMLRAHPAVSSSKDVPRYSAAVLSGLIGET